MSAVGLIYWLSAPSADDQDIHALGEIVAQAANGTNRGRLIEFTVPNRRRAVIELFTALSGVSSRWQVTDISGDSASHVFVDMVEGDDSTELLIVLVPVGSFFDIVVVPLHEYSWYIDRGYSVSMVIQKFDGCEIIDAVGDLEEPVPMASVAKLGILSAVEAAINEGELSPETPVVIDEDQKSLPSGTWQDLPDGEESTIGEAIYQTYVASDNTAADILVHVVGRERLTEWISDVMHSDTSGVPFVTTAEAYKLNWGRPDLRNQYLAATYDDRLEILSDLHQEALPSVSEVLDNAPTSPVIGWTGLASGLCPTWAALVDSSIGEILSSGELIPVEMIGLRPIGGKGGLGPDVNAFSGVGEDACGDGVVMSAFVSGPQPDPWMATACQDEPLMPTSVI